jgi:hypothetical protein
MAHTSHVVAVMDELLEAMFSTRSMPRLYKGVSFSVCRVRSRRLGCSEVGVRWPPACTDVSSEAEERPPLEALTEQRDWKHWSVCNSDLWGVVTSCISVQQIQSLMQNPSLVTLSRDNIYKVLSVCICVCLRICPWLAPERFNIFCSYWVFKSLSIIGRGPMSMDILSPKIRALEMGSKNQNGNFL